MFNKSPRADLAMHNEYTHSEFQPVLISRCIGRIFRKFLRWSFFYRNYITRQSKLIFRKIRREIAKSIPKFSYNQIHLGRDKTLIILNGRTKNKKRKNTN